MTYVQVYVVDRDEALRHVNRDRARWRLILDHVRRALSGQVVEVVLWPEWQEPPSNHRVRLYNASAVLRKAARQAGMAVRVWLGHDGRRLFVERFDSATGG